ncbi:MarR family winged helix-turn-helix transcriptional regulator [Thalassotalea ganghwensis]
MKNVFSPTVQINNLEAKLIASIERIATLFKSSLQDTAKSHRLTPLQAQLLLFIAEHPNKFCSVGELAKEFSVTKATASDSLKTLLKKSYIEKTDNAADARSFSYKITDSAKTVVSELSQLGNKMTDVITTLDQEELLSLYNLNLILLNKFSQTGLINTRMCLSCHYYQEKEQGFYCRLMEKSLPQVDLRIDCPEHLPSLE